MRGDQAAWRTPWAHHVADGLLFSAVIFALLPSGFSWTNFEDSSTFVSGSIGYQLQWGSVFAVSAWLVMRRPDTFVRSLKSVNPFLLAILVYCVIGLAWSPYAVVTLKKTIQVAGLIIFSIAIQQDGKPWTHSVKVILAALTAIEIASAFAAIFIPSFGIDAYFGYAWKGVVSGKNTLGAIGALSLLLWLSVAHLNHIKKSAWWAGVGLSFVSVVMSTSSTSLVVAVVGAFIFWLLRRQHIGSPMWLQRLLVMAALALLLSTHLFFIFEGRLPEPSELLGPFASLFGKSADLTGRADIWAPLLIEFDKHWLLGIGYGAFWLGPGSPSQPVLDTLQWIPLQAHNGYLDVLNELGVIGGIFFLGFLAMDAHRLSQLVRVDRNAAAFFSAILGTLLISNISESSLFRGVSFNFLLLILSSVRVGTMLDNE